MRTSPAVNRNLLWVILSILWDLVLVKVEGCIIVNELRVSPVLLTSFLEMSFNRVDVHLHLLGGVKLFHLILIVAFTFVILISLFLVVVGHVGFNLDLNRLS